MLKNSRSILSLLLSVAPFLPFLLHAQEGRRFVNIENSEQVSEGKVEIIYEEERYDPVSDRRETKYLMLQADNGYSYQRDYGHYRLDSAVMNIPYKLTRQQLGALRAESGFSSYFPRFIWDKIMNRYAEIDFAMGSFIYFEEREQIPWTLRSDSVRVILGRSCYGAEADFRGRKWTVWYSAEVPVAAGPYKLDGLPGAVLAARSEDGHFRYTAIAIRNAKMPIILPLMDREEKRYFRGTREEWYRAISRHHWSFKQSLTSSGMAPRDQNGEPVEFENRVLPYFPIELDWMSPEMREKWLSGKNPLE